MCCDCFGRFIRATVVFMRMKKILSFSVVIYLVYLQPHFVAELTFPTVVGRSSASLAVKANLSVVGPPPQCYSPFELLALQTCSRLQLIQF